MTHLKSGVNNFRMYIVHRTPLRRQKSTADGLCGVRVATGIAHMEYVFRKTRHFECIISICSSVRSIRSCVSHIKNHQHPCQKMYVYPELMDFARQCCEFGFSGPSSVWQTHVAVMGAYCHWADLADRCGRCGFSSG